MVVHLAVELLVDLLQRQALDLDKRPPDNHRLRKVVHAVDHVVFPRDVVERDRNHVLVEEAEPERDDLRERHALGPDTVVDDFDRIRHAQRRVAEGVGAAEQEHHEDQRVGGVDVGSVRVVFLDGSHDEQTHAHEQRGPQQNEHTAKPLGQIRAGGREEQVRDLQTQVQHDLPSRRRVAGVLQEQAQVGAHDVASGQLRGHAHPENDPQSPAVAPGLQHGLPADPVLLLVVQDLLDFLKLEGHERPGHVEAGKEAAVLRFDHLGNVRGGAHRVDGDGHADDDPADNEHGPVAGAGLQTDAQKRQHRSDKHASLAPDAANIDQLRSEKTPDNRPDVDGGREKPLHARVQVEEVQVLVDHVEVGHHALVHAHGAAVDDGARQCNGHKLGTIDALGAYYL
ncbi:hypothetical protein KL920_003675 [Ogataea angusta]|nr:hypothetical protein KL920_003675 [Ogataea angusta]